ncbi:unnamed protein product [Caenorhabditis sp. 36 PRJEB53466]|nr:unnamed protein product [Caenorhabditis sp. 36 PRJEB53466]
MSASKSENVYFVGNPLEVIFYFGRMEDLVPSIAPQEVYIPQKLKAFVSEPQGCALVAALEGQFKCTITVINDSLTVSSGTVGVPVDITQIEAIIRDVWQKRDIQLMIREAALNASCNNVCQTILPRAYCAVVVFFSADFQRRSRCNDIIVEHFTGKVSIFGAELSVNLAREAMIECLTEHFGPLEIEIPLARRTTRMGYNLNSFNPEVSQSQMPIGGQNPFMNGMFSMGEPNAILTSTPVPPPPSKPPGFNETLLSASFDNQLMFPTVQPDFTIPPPQSPTPKTNNVEKAKYWIPSEDVGKILGNRAAMKKQIEGQFNCVITVHAEGFPHFGMTAVEIMAQNKDQCQGARDVIMSMMTSNQEMPPAKSPSTDSGFNSPATNGDSSATTPEKRSGASTAGPRVFRSSFRDQPKVMLALTPRKTSS